MKFGYHKICMFGMINECRLLSVPRHTDTNIVFRGSVAYPHKIYYTSLLYNLNETSFLLMNYIKGTVLQRRDQTVVFEMQLFICLFICFVGGVLREDGAVRRQTPPGQAGQKEDRGACPYH